MSSYRLKTALKAKIKKTLLLSIIVLPITASAHTHSEHHVQLNKKHHSKTERHHSNSHVVTHHHNHRIVHKDKHAKALIHDAKHEQHHVHLTYHVHHKTRDSHHLGHSRHQESTKKHKIPIDYYTLKGHYEHHQSFWSELAHFKLSEKWRSKIWHAYSHWAHTPYLYGGNSHHGIDCSAFVRRVFDEVYHVHLPRTTLQQVKLGYKVRKENLHYGDLVFFKTGSWHHHVGIYLDHGRFVNATSSRGVAISNINRPYWRKRLWQIRRLID